MRVIKGNIGADRAFIPDVLFSPQGADDKKMLGIPTHGEGSHLLRERVHITPTNPYTFQDELSCKLNEMRSNHGTPDWRNRP
jgi:hypothetical protein